MVETVPTERVVRTKTLRARFGRAGLSLLGWRLAFALPSFPRGILIVYPHTSNWDFFVGYLAKLALGLPLRWVGKDEIFFWPLGPILKWMGGIPANRRERKGLIGKLTEEFERSPWMWLAMAPEGTRKHTDHLKSGFWRLALAAHLPVGLVSFDWRTKVIGLREYLMMTGDEAVDLERIRASYAGVEGKHRGQEGALRFLPPE